MYLHMRFPEGKAKAVTLSYDDGVRQDLRLAELTAKRGIKCTFNINSALVEKEPGGVRLTWDEIRSRSPFTASITSRRARPERSSGSATRSTVGCGSSRSSGR